MNSGIAGHMKSLAGVVTGALAGVGVAAAVKSVAEIGMTYQDTMNNLRAVSAATDAQMKAVGDTAKALGADTQLTATSAADAAIAMTELAKGGLSVDEAMQAAKGTLQLAAAAGITASEAATIQSAALNAFSLEADQAGRVSDVLANAANAAAGEIGDFAQGMSQASAVAAATGISLEDTAATLGILANNGIAGSDAGTLLKSALLALQSPSGPAIDAMKELGLSAYDAAGNFVGLESVFEQLSVAQKGMTDEQYAAATSTLFGSDAARLAGIAAKEGGEGFAAMADAMSKGGSAADVAAAKSQGVRGSIEALKSQIETVQINVFEKIAPAVEDTLRRVGESFSTLTEQVPNLWAAFTDADAQGIGEVLDNILGNTGEHVDTFRAAAEQFFPVWESLKTSLSNAVDIVRDLGPLVGIVLAGGFKLAWEAVQLLAPVIESVTGFLADNEWAVYTLVGAYAGLKAVMAAHAAAMAVQAAGGMAAWIRSTRIVTGLTKAWTAIQWAFNIAMRANPLVLIGTLLVALGAGLVLAYQKSETFQNIVKGAFDAVASAGIWLWENALKPAFDAIKTAWDATLTGISWAWENILKPVFDVLKTVAQALGIFLLVVVFGPIMLAWKVMTEAIKFAWDNILKPVWDAVAFAATWLWDNALAPVFGWIKQGWDLLLKGIDWAWNNVLKPAWDAIAGAATWLWEKTLKVVFGAIEFYWNAILTAIKWAWENILKPVWDAVSAAATWLWERVLSPVFSAISSAWDGLASGFQWVFDHLIKPVFDAFTSVVETVKEGFGTAVDWIGRTWETLKDTLMSPVQWVIDFVWNDGLRKLWNTINNLWGGDDLNEFKLARGGVYDPNSARARANGQGAYATGGVLPGYTPGRDVHHFVSPTGGRLHLSGGEAVMRPEFTKAMGVHGVNTLNKIARQGGAKAVAAALGAQNNLQQSHADGGIINLPGWLSTALKFIPGMGAVGDIVNAINGGDGFGGGLFGEGLIGTAKSIGTKLWDKAKSLFEGDGGGGFGASKGSPNGVGGLGPMAKAARQFVMNTWGITNIGGYANRNIAGTGVKSDHALGKAIDVMIPNYKSASGIALGNQIAAHFVNNPGQFGTKYVIWRDRINNGRGWEPYGHPGGGRSDTLQHRDHVHTSLYDDGGILPPGLSLTENRSGKPEAVFTADEFEVFREIAKNGGGAPVVGGDLILRVDPNSDIRDQMESAMHELRRIKRGGGVR